MTVHRFDASLAYSQRQANKPWWRDVYEKAFPGMLDMIDLSHDGWHQRAGRDRAVILSTGRAVYVDEKVRTKGIEVWPDYAVEVWSQYPKTGRAPYRPTSGAKEGWAVEAKDCDWLAYAWEPSQVCHLLPYLGVRAAWERHRVDWLNAAEARRTGYRWVVADNGSYNTISIGVPIADLRAAISNAMTVTWSAGQAADGAA